MLRSYKTEINPTPEQVTKIRQTIGVCRYVYNFYISENKAEYERTGGFLSAFTFSKWLNNEYLPTHDDKAWIRDVSSKAVKKAICNAERAFKNFFAGRTEYPRYKKKRSYDATMYFVKTDRSTIIACDRHRIKIPTLGWVRLKEKGYIPTNPKTHTIKSGTVSYHAGRYYVSVLVEEAEPPKPVLNNSGVGIDLGVKDFAILSDGTVHRNINKTRRVRRLNKRLKHEQRRLSRQYEMLKQKGGRYFMGHLYHFSYLKAETDEDALAEGLAEAMEFAYYEGDRYEGSDYYNNSFKLYNKKFEHESDALDFFDSLGAYVDGIVLVKHPSDAMARNYDKRKKALNIKEENIKMKAKDTFKTRKSKTISCKHCGRRMTNETALRNQLRCTNCYKYLYPNGVLAKLEKASEARQALEKKYRQDIADNGKYKYFMKAEIHC